MWISFLWGGIEYKFPITSQLSAASSQYYMWRRGTFYALVEKIIKLQWHSGKSTCVVNRVCSMYHFAVFRLLQFFIFGFISPRHDQTWNNDEEHFKFNWVVSGEFKSSLSYSRTEQDLSGSWLWTEVTKLCLTVFLAAELLFFPSHPTMM